jgi:hypothetical protein
MLSIVRLPRLFRTLHPQTVHFWLGMSLAIGCLCGFLQLHQAFSQPYTVQDDARQHVFWMRRFLDPALFPGDWIADYYQSVAPIGYATLYRLVAWAGIDPIDFSKVLPAILGILTSVYGFWVCVELFPVAIAGFFAVLFLNQNLWSQDDLASGTARAFLYPLVLAFFYYLLRKKWLLCLGTIALQGLFYPPCIFTSVGVLLLRWLSWRDGRFQLSTKPFDYQFGVAGVAIAILVLLPTLISTSEFGATVSKAIAQTMPEFSSTGRTAFFLTDGEQFWFKAQRSGLFPYEWGVLPFWFKPPQVWLSLLLPVLLGFSPKFPLIRHLRRNNILLLQVLIVSFSLFLLAHALLFKLYLPSRYTQPNLRIIAAIGGAIVLTTLLNTLWNGAKWKLGAILLLVLVVTYPLFRTLVGRSFPELIYITGTAPQLYQFLSHQPKATVVASITEESENIPTFAQRSTLVGREYAIPYSTGYYQEIRQRTQDLITAQYSPDSSVLQSTIEHYHINFWLIEATAFHPPYLEKNQWLMQYKPAATQAIAHLQQGKTPALVKTIPRCTVLREKQFILLNTECMLADR